tara:strand:- start:372 stop:1112 length:741 start_codon:yes stop_codon:yes gene_type:complete
MAEFKFPSEMVDLPSKGLLYPEGSALSSGTIEMKYMTAREEDILTNQNYIRKGVVVDKLLKSLILTDINYEDLLIGDKDAILIASRILGYGKDYKFTFSGEEIEVDLTTLKEKPLDESLIITPLKNEFEFKLPHSGNKITFKLLTQKDDINIDKEIEGYKKISKEENKELTTRLKMMILSVNGDSERSTINNFVDTAFLARDSKSFREYYNKINPGVDTKIKYEFLEGIEEDLDIPINMNFFWPDA